MTARPIEWTDDNRMKLKAMWNRGDKLGDIVERFPGRTKNAILGQVHRLRLDGHAMVRRMATPVRRPKPEVVYTPPPPPPLPPASPAAIRLAQFDPVIARAIEGRC